MAILNNSTLTQSTTLNSSRIPNSLGELMASSTWYNPEINAPVKAGKGEIYTKLDSHGIYSNIINGKNALIMLQTMKNLLVSKGIITEEEFEKEYQQIKEELVAYEEALMVAEKLMEEPKKTFYDYEYVTPPVTTVTPVMHINSPNSWNGLDDGTLYTSSLNYINHTK